MYSIDGLLPNADMDKYVDGVIAGRLQIPELNRNTSHTQPYKQFVEFPKADKETENPKRPFNDIMTDFVNNEFFTDKRLVDYLKLVFNTVYYSLDQYKKKKGLPDNSIIFVYKGGNLLRMIFLQFMENYFTTKLALTDQFKGWFKRSDADFSTYVDPGLPDYKKVYNEVNILTYYILCWLRDDFIQNKLTYFGYFNKTDEEKNSILQKYLGELNDSDALKDPNNEYSCGKFKTLKFEWNIVGDSEMNRVSQQVAKERQINSIRKQKNPDASIYGRYDFGIIEDPNKDNQQVYYTFHETTGPKGQVEEKFLKKNDIYVSYNSTIVIERKYTAIFNLIRSKINAKAVHVCTVDAPQFGRKIGDEITLNLGGELVDNSLSGTKVGYDSHLLEHFFDDLDEVTKKYKGVNGTITEGLEFLAYSPDYLIFDLERMLFIDQKYPWNDRKYAKRIGRVMFFYLQKMLEDDEDKHVGSFFKNILSGNDKLTTDTLRESREAVLAFRQFFNDNLMALENSNGIEYYSQLLKNFKDPQILKDVGQTQTGGNFVTIAGLVYGGVMGYIIGQSLMEGKGVPPIVPTPPELAHSQKMDYGISDKLLSSVPHESMLVQDILEQNTHSLEEPKYELINTSRAVDNMTKKIKSRPREVDRKKYDYLYTFLERVLASVHNFEEVSDSLLKPKMEEFLKVVVDNFEFIEKFLRQLIEITDKGLIQKEFDSSTLTLVGGKRPDYEQMYRKCKRKYMKMKASEV